MKKFILALFAVLLPLAVLADGTPTVPATQLEVNAGKLHGKFVAPDTLAGWASGAGAPQAASFIASNSIADPGVKKDVNGFVGQLISEGYWTNLVDAAFFNPRFNPTNNLTLFGRTIQSSNINYDSWGAVLDGTAQIVVDGLPSLTTNTIVCVWRGFPTNSSTSTNSCIFGLFNTNGDGAWTANVGGQQFKIITESNVTQGGNADLTTLIIPGKGDQYSYTHVYTSWEDRKVWALSFDGIVASGGVFHMWQNGVPMKLNFNGPFFLTTNAVASTNTFNEIRVGYALTNNVGGKFVGEVAAVLVFNTPMTTSMAYAVNRAVRWLEPDTVNRIFVGDSLWTEGVFTSDNWNTNCPVSIFMNSQAHKNESCFINLAESGQQYGELTSVDCSNAVFTANAAPEGKVTRTELYLDYGVNDSYAGVGTPTTIFTSATNAAQLATKNKMLLYVMNIGPLWTGATSPYTYSSATETTNQNYNFLLETNRQMFAGVFRKDLVIGQPEMNTNNNYSLDGLHLYGTNGFIQNQRLASLMLGNQVGELLNTNTLSVAASGVTNNTPNAYILSVTAGTSLAMKDQYGNQFLTPVLGSAYPMRPGWRFTGTAVTATCTQFQFP